MFRAKVNGHLAINKQLKALRLPAGKRRTINRALSRRVMSYSRKRIREQRDLDGRAWKDRKSGRGKMLKGLSRRMKAQANSDVGKIRFASGKVAAKHQHGHTEKFDADKIAERTASVNTDTKAATRSQAKRLKSLGYKRRRGKRYSRPTQAWIMKNMTMSQAGAIIRVMNGGGSADSWEVVLPARSFLGVTDTEDKLLLDLLVQKLK